MKIQSGSPDAGLIVDTSLEGANKNNLLAEPDPFLMHSLLPGPEAMNVKHAPATNPPLEEMEDNLSKNLTAPFLLTQWLPSLNTVVEEKNNDLSSFLPENEYQLPNPSLSLNFNPSEKAIETMEEALTPINKPIESDKINRLVYEIKPPISQEIIFDVTGKMTPAPQLERTLSDAPVNSKLLQTLPRFNEAAADQTSTVNIEKTPTLKEVSNFSINLTDPYVKELDPPLQPAPQNKETVIPMNESFKASLVQDSRDEKPVEALLGNLTHFINKQTITTSPGAHNRLTQSPLARDFSFTMAEIENSAALSNNIKTTYKVGEYTAKISIHPPELGLITANIQMHEGKAELILTADNQHIKNFLESHLNQLRENFQEANIHLSQASVQDQSHREASDYQQQHTFSESNAESKELPQISSSKREDKSGSDSIIDTYA